MASFDNYLAFFDIMDTFSYFRTSEDAFSPIQIGGADFVPETFHLGQEPQAFRLHHHDVYHAILYRRGDAFVINEQVVNAPAGMLVMISPGCLHDFSSRNPSPGEYHELTFSLHGKSSSLCFRQLVTDICATCPTDDYILLPVAQAEAVHQRFERSAELIAADRRTAASALATLLFEIIATVAATPRSLAPVDCRLEKMRRLLEQPFDIRLTSAELVTASHLSYEHICRAFKRQYGIAPLTYRRNLRLDASKQLLRFSRLSIKEIAESLGFNDQYEFSRAFIKRFAIAPGRFRKEN